LVVVSFRSAGFRKLSVLRSAGLGKLYCNDLYKVYLHEYDINRPQLVGKWKLLPNMVRPMNKTH